MQLVKYGLSIRDLSAMVVVFWPWRLIQLDSEPDGGESGEHVAEDELHSSRSARAVFEQALIAYKFLAVPRPLCFDRQLLVPQLTQLVRLVRMYHGGPPYDRLRLSRC